jgi:hypothetical protein
MKKFVKINISFNGWNIISIVGINDINDVAVIDDSKYYL